MARDHSRFTPGELATRQLLSSTVAVAAASTLVMGPNPSRRVLWVSGFSAVAVSLAFGEAAVLNRGITIQNATEPLKLTWDDLGDAIYQSVFAIAAAPQTVGFAEVVGD